MYKNGEVAYYLVLRLYSKVTRYFGSSIMYGEIIWMMEKS